MTELASEPSHPNCPICNVPMWLVKIEKAESGEELHHFECKVCEATMGHLTSRQMGKAGDGGATA
jgi:hypothetical protein